LKKIVFETIEIWNFRNYEYMTFKFEPNRFCVITGPNGAGKTTLVVDAICWCLYDETSKGRKGDSVIRKRSGKNTRIVLKFRIENEEYIIENNRAHDEYGDMKVFKKDGVSISGATRSETNKRIVDVLMPKDVFKNCLLFSQYVSKPFAEMGDTGQKNIFDMMMGFGKYNEYYDKSKQHIKEIELEISKLKEDLMLLNENHERNKELLDSELMSRKKIEEDYKNRKDVLERDIIELTNINSKLEKDKDINDDLPDKLKRKQDDISETASKIAIIKNKFEDEKRLVSANVDADRKNDLVNVEKKFRDILTDINTELESINNKYSVLKQEINAKNESLKSEYYKRENDIKNPINNEMDIVLSASKDLVREQEVLRESISNITRNCNSLVIDIKDKEEQLNKDVPICYACKQEVRGSNLEEINLILKNEKENLKKYEDELIILNAKDEDINNKIHEKDILIKNLNDKKDSELIKLDQWKEAELKLLQDYRDKSLLGLNKRDSDLKMEKRQIDGKMCDEIDIIEKKYKDILYEKIENIGKEFATSIFKLEAKLLDLNRDKDIIDELIIHDRDIDNKININNGTIHAKKEELNNIITSSYKEHLNECIIRVQKLENIVSEVTIKIENMRNTIDELSRKLKIAKFWKKSFSPKGIRAILLDESIPILNEEAKELSSMTDCIRVRFSSQKPLKSGEMRNQFCVLPIQTKNLTDEREDFSQGEGRMVDIITLLSLRHLLEVTYDRTFNISLFDEILDSLYRDNAEIVLDFLRKMSKDSCTILITHTLRNYIEPDEHLELGR